MTRFVVDPPARDAHRDQIEREVFAKLAAIQAAERADRAVPTRPRWRYGLALAGALAATVAIAIAVRGEGPAAPDAAPSLVVTPTGGSSRFTVGDAVIDAGSDTSVEVRPGEAGGVTLVLARGSVDCDVAPRGHRLPFRVVAGDVTVEVVGTRFTVARRPAVRVDVARGKVKVSAPGGTTLVTAGESWPAITAAAEPAEANPTSSAAQTTTSAAQTTTSAAQTTTSAAQTTTSGAQTTTSGAQTTTSGAQTTREAARPAMSPEAAYRAASKLAATDPAKAAAAYRAIARGSDVWAAIALGELAELDAKRDPVAGLRDYDEFLRRFPHSASIEDVAWRRIDLLRAAGRKDEARSAAGEFVRRFPSSSYADSAKRLAQP